MGERDFSKIRLLEVGSLDVNGTIRGLFAGTNYTGVDLMAGAGVDLVASGHQLDLPAELFDITLSCECFEHNPFWIETFENMCRMTKPGGLIVVTCAARGRLEHGTKRTSPQTSPGTQAIGIDYYRNLNEDDFRAAIPFDSRFQYVRFFQVPSSFDTYFIGVKAGSSLFSSHYEAVASGVQAIIDERPSITLRRVLAVARNIPISLSRKILRESSFQTFSVHYIRVIQPLEKFIKSMFRTNSRI